MKDNDRKLFFKTMNLKPIENNRKIMAIINNLKGKKIYLKDTPVC
jgi:hypothetical protein